MTARAKKNAPVTRRDAKDWRRFLTKTPPLTDLIEMKRLHDTKTSLRRQGDLPSVAPRRVDFRPFG